MMFEVERKMEKQVSAPVIYETAYTDLATYDLEEKVRQEIGEENVEYITDYPTVYIIQDDRLKKRSKYKVYVGETNDIAQRTNEHLIKDSKNGNYWDNFRNSKTSLMYVIGHEHFNKSLTLDIENKMMQYLSCVPNVEKIHNKRTNAQKKYYTSNEMSLIFTKIWKKLHEKNQNLFISEQEIVNSAIFKASPFHSLTKEQEKAQTAILELVDKAIAKKQSGQLILVRGEAGSGKTVLMSSLFYNLAKRAKDVHLLVNHNEQLTVYKTIASKLDLEKKKDEVVAKPTSFINKHSPKQKVDVILVDEAHLLLTQGKQSYRGKNQLIDLLDRAKVVIAVFDDKQILTREQIWQEDILQTLGNDYPVQEFTLMNQMRMNANEKTIDWLRTLIDDGTIKTLPKDDKYDLRVFDDPAKMHQAIVEKNQEQAGLSRMVATFDWEYKTNSKGDLSYVQIGDWKLPWNLQLKDPNSSKEDSWAEQAITINEIGSTYTIQGFDLNYAGVILGPSVTYRDGKIVFDPAKSANKKATQRRSIITKEGSQMISFGPELLKHELNVLLTRGVKGLYLYAVDEQLQKALMEKVKISN